MDKFQDKFVEEATDLINNLEELLLTLEKQTDDKELIAAIFRIMHSLKGGGGMFGFEAISSFTHSLETIYDEVRNGRKEITEDLLSVSFSSVDHLRNLLSADALKDEQISKHHATLLAKVENLLNSDTDKPEVDAASSQKDGEDTGAEKSYFIKFIPESGVMDNGTNPLYIVDELCSLGSSLVFPRVGKIPTFNDDFKPNKCYVSWDIILVTDQILEAIKEVFIFVEDESDVEICEIANGNILRNSFSVENIKEKYQDVALIDTDELKTFLEKIDSENSKVDNSVKEKLNTFTKENVISSIRVDSDKIDQLMNIVSELVTTQASLSLYVDKNQVFELNQLSENIDNITRQLRDTAFSISLIPIETMLVRFQRLIRDLSTEFGKNIEFITEGAETELDKTIVQGLTEPLMHIIRNSIDHGIESEKERIEKGKTPQGMIYLKTYYSGSNVVIMIQDDGRGIDLEKIRKKAISKDLISQDTQMTEREILDLIFISGFSTAENVTDVSGRGVGMDVVRKKINEIRGTVEVETKKNIGTTTTIKLPLTLSIIDGLLVNIGDSKYIVPLSLVEKIYTFKHKEFESAYNNLITVEEEQLPFYNLRKEFDIPGEPQTDEKLVMVKYEETRVGLVVDNVVGEYQAVLKPLGKLYMNNELISGATILGDGTIALVLDTNKIINKFSFKN